MTSYPNLIVIEGTDGSGKASQTKLLFDRLKQDGHDVYTFDFPRYDSFSSYFVKKYLQGEYGDLKDIKPEQAAIFFALDRFDWGITIKDLLDEGKIVLLDRYVGSNMAHQGARIDDQVKRKEFFSWLYRLEYEIFNIPRPKFNIILHVPALIGQKLVTQRGNKKDIHEKDAKHLEKAEKVYLEIASLFKQEFSLIECISNEKLDSKEVIHEKIWKMVSEYLNKEI